MNRQRICPFVIIFLAFSTLAGCNFPSSTEDPTSNDPGAIAAHTLETVFTQVGHGTDISIEEPLPVNATTIAGESASAILDTDCFNRAEFVEDITIRDNTQVESGSSFVKTWRLRNDGTCIWNQTYNLAFIGGERMSAPIASTLSQVIQPGQTIDLSINLIAPEGSGEYQGFWKLQSDTKDFFGIGSTGEQSFWVKINVISSLTATPTGFTTPLATPSFVPQPEQTPSITITPEATRKIHYQGSSSLRNSQSIDLDTGHISPPNGSDLSIIGSTWIESSITPQNNAQFSLYSEGSTPPDYIDCQNTPLSEDPIFITGLAVDDIICYSTNVGRFGYLTIDDLNSIFEFTLTTWGP